MRSPHARFSLGPVALTDSPFFSPALSLSLSLFISLYHSFYPSLYLVLPSSNQLGQVGSIKSAPPSPSSHRVLSPPFQHLLLRTSPSEFGPRDQPLIPRHISILGGFFLRPPLFTIHLSRPSQPLSQHPRFPSQPRSAIARRPIWTSSAASTRATRPGHPP